MLSNSPMAKVLEDIEALRREIDRLKSFDVPSKSDTSDGWVNPNETWTYASAATFTVPGNLTAKYTAGVKIKLYNGSQKYFYVVSSSYGAPNTTVTVAGGSSYSLSNVAISANYYSRASNPLGFPHWFNYTATLSGGGGTIGTYAEDNNSARFCVVGRICFIRVAKRVTNKGSWTGNVIMALPIDQSNGPNLQNNPCWWATGAIAAKANTYWFNQVSSIQFVKTVYSAFFGWTDMAVNDVLQLDAFYEI